MQIKNSELVLTKIFIQARMSSSRFPGKVLAPIEGVPLIKKLVERLSSLDAELIVLTSNELSDDPLAFYLERIGVKVFRGDLDNVFLRFNEAARYYSCDYFVRICADSPFIDKNLVNNMINYAETGEYDVISNVFSRTFPKGQSVEIIRAKSFFDINQSILSEEEKEHVTPYFYKNKENYKCLFLDNLKDLSYINQCVDMLDDLKEVEKNKKLYSFNEQDICVWE